ncbi:aspartate aminotransferase family protein [Pendulispora albinea]|uniref:Acetylornithine aminotransferase n=1 Tax=Pendulispora albinea TaxID=2741071 RepID=A0ABZ2LSB1_9BACT
MPSPQEELLEIAKRRLYGNYRPAPVVFVRGQGCELFDANDQRYLDLCAGVAVCSVGHAHPALVKTIAEQAGRLMHVSNYFYNDQAIRLADELCRRTGFAQAFLCNSGTEANEALLKLARRHFYGLGQTGRARVIAFDNAFHGRSLGAVSMTGTPKYREGFGVPGNVTHVPYGDVEAVKKAMGPDVAAVIAEPIQGEGGVFPAPAGFFASLRALCDEHGALFLIDEVQTGIGRTGRFLALEKDGVRPDAIALAKGLGGGFPVGAMLTTEKVANALPPGTHGSTFGGNPLACATALSVLRIVDDEKLVEGARTKGAALLRMLDELVREFPNACEAARGEGLLVGLLLREGFVARDVLPLIQREGVLLIAAGDRVIRFAPPLVVTEAQLAEGVAALRRVVAALDAARRGAA